MQANVNTLNNEMKLEDGHFVSLDNLAFMIPPAHVVSVCSPPRADRTSPSSKVSHHETTAAPNGTERGRDLRYHYAILAGWVVFRLQNLFAVPLLGAVSTTSPP